MYQDLASSWSMTSLLRTSQLGGFPGPQPPGTPRIPRHCDWQEAGYPQGNPSSRLGDPRRLHLNSVGNQGCQPSVGGPASFHGNPRCLIRAWKGRKAAGRNSCRKRSPAGLLPCVPGESRCDLSFPIQAALPLRLDSHLCSGNG